MAWDKYRVAPPNNEKTGLPELEEGRADTMGYRSAIIGTIVPLINALIGYLLAYLIYYFGDSDAYDLKRIALEAFDGQWLLLGLIIFQLVVQYMNSYPTRFKERFMHFMGNLRSNPFIYQEATAPSGEATAIIMAEDGDIGAYNRGNRALHHFLENSLPLAISLPVAGFLYPFPTFVLLCVFCVGCLVYQAGYANRGFGGHLPGFMIRLISTNMVTGLLIIAYTKMVI